MTPCKFTFDDTPEFEGFAHGSTWNGFDNVYVAPEVREQIAAYFQSINDPDGAADIRSIDTMDNGMISLGWGYATQIVRSEG